MFQEAAPGQDEHGLCSEQGLFPHFTEAFCVRLWSVFTVGAEHVSEGGVEARSDQSCSDLGMFTSNKHQECREVSQTLPGRVTVARAHRAVEAPHPTACGLWVPKLPVLPLLLKGGMRGLLPAATGSPGTDHNPPPLRSKKWAFWKLFWARV